MTLKERISEDIKQAMKNRDQGALRALRAIKSAILLAETAAGASGDLSAEEELKLLTRQAKQRKDSIEQFKANGREDLAVSEEEELVVIEQYLPKQMSEAEIRAEVQAIISSVGASGAGDIGKVMGPASKAMAGKADGKLINQIARELLGGA
jgi:uncharacterized protein YqeY